MRSMRELPQRTRPSILCAKNNAEYIKELKKKNHIERGTRRGGPPADNGFSCDMNTLAGDT